MQLRLVTLHDSLITVPTYRGTSSTYLSTYPGYLLSTACMKEFQKNVLEGLGPSYRINICTLMQPDHTYVVIIPLHILIVGAILGFL